MAEPFTDDGSRLGLNITVSARPIIETDASMRYTLRVAGTSCTQAGDTSKGDSTTPSCLTLAPSLLEDVGFPLLTDRLLALR